MNYSHLFLSTLPETVLEVAALLVLVVDLGFLRKAELKTRTSVATLLGVIGCTAALWAQFWTSEAHGIWGYGVEGSHHLLLFNLRWAGAAQAGILVLTGLTLLLLTGSAFTRHAGEYVAVVLMSATGGLIISSARDLLIIFIGLELLSLGLYILTAFAKASGRSAEAALKYYLFGGMSAAFLLFGFSYLYGLTGSTNLEQIAAAISNSSAIVASPLLYVAWVAIAAGLGFKVAAVPFHLWAPDTYEGAPAPAAAFIASVSKVASFALLITIVSEVFSPKLSLVLVVLAAASMLVGNLAALAQVSVRRLLAYSAIAHAGYMLLALAYLRIDESASWWEGAKAFGSANAVLYYILSYGLTTVGAFGVIGVVERATGSDRMDAFLGLHKRSPLLAAVLLVLFLSLAGIPPLVGFWAKFNLFAAVLSASEGVLPFTLVALAVAMSAVSLYYYLQVLKRAYVMSAVDDSRIRVNPVTAMVLLLIAAAVVVMGCFPDLLRAWIASFYPVL
jgi:NADH-quinone oxidoreductase subunit N